MSERRVFEIPEELRACGVERYATVLGNRWEWYSSLYGAEHETPLWSLNRPATTLLMNERIRQWLLKELEGGTQKPDIWNFEGDYLQLADGRRVYRVRMEGFGEVRALVNVAGRSFIYTGDRAARLADADLCWFAPLDAVRPDSCAESVRQQILQRLGEEEEEEEPQPKYQLEECEVEYEVGMVIVRCRHG